MDWTSLIGPAVVAAAVSSVVSIVGFYVSAKTARSIHTQRLAFDEKQTERKYEFDKGMTEKKFSYDRELSERKLSQDLEQLVYRRRFELAEGLLADAYRFRGLIHDARAGGSFGVEGTTRKSVEGESEQVKNTKDMYYIPVERLRKDGEFIAGFFSKQFTATAQFGPQAKESFGLLIKVVNTLLTASGLLITMVGQPSLDDQKVKDELLDVLWAGRAKALGREDKVEAEIEQAVAILEAIFRPVLERTAS